MGRHAKVWIGIGLSGLVGASVPAQLSLAVPVPAGSRQATSTTTFLAGASADQASLAEARATSVVQGGSVAGPGFPIDASVLFARAINAATPFQRKGLGAAQPFYLNASGEDIARATDCLAAATYYEAGNGAADQRAVGQVVLNRVRHRAFPSSVCGVVFQGSERRTGCQFTFTCDGALATRTPAGPAWQAARRLATQMLLGLVEPTVGLATHYHTDWVSPSWDRSMDKIAAVRTHLFYRWRGRQDFLAPYAGSEPNVPQLARLSDAHRAPRPDVTLPDGTVPAAGALVQPGAFPATGGPVGSGITSSGIAGSPVAPAAQAVVPPSFNVFLVTLPQGGGPASFQALAEQRCAGQRQCRFIGWTNAAHTPRSLPMSGTAVDAIAFVFERRPESAVAVVKWDCSRFGSVGDRACI